MTRLLDDVSRCDGTNCTWKKQCSRWLQRLTGASSHPRLCSGTGTRDNHEMMLDERRGG